MVFSALRFFYGRLLVCSRRVRGGSIRHRSTSRTRLSNTEGVTIAVSYSPLQSARLGYRWACSAGVLRPKARHVWVRGSHRRTGGTLDKFKATRDGRLAHHGGLPKILRGNHVPAAVADRRIGLQPDAPGGSSWLVGNLGSLTDRHRVLQTVHARPAAWAPGSLLGSPAGSCRNSLCPGPMLRSIDGARYRVIKVR